MGVCEALCDMLACKKGYTNTFDLIYHTSGRTPQVEHFRYHTSGTTPQVPHLRYNN